jgi:ATP phosphoribosyltransferase regulatory subunit
VLELALDAMLRSGIEGLVLDMADARIVQGVLAGTEVDPQRLADLVQALSAKDVASLSELSAGLPSITRNALRRLTSLYGGVDVLEAARRELPENVLITQALDDLARLSLEVAQSHAEVEIGFDLADQSGYAYYSGTRFALYAEGASDALVRGGRYDEVGAVFGRNRPAVGFSLDLKLVASLATVPSRHAAIRAAWGGAAPLRSAVRRLREQGETVVRVLPGHEDEAQEYECDRELVEVDGHWVVRPLAAVPNTESRDRLQ